VSLGDGLSDVIKFGVSESFSVSPMDVDEDDNMVLGWDWIWSHDLRSLYADSECRVRVSLRYGPVLLQLGLLQASVCPYARLLQAIASDRPWGFSQARSPQVNCAGGSGGPGGLRSIDANPASSRTSTTSDPAPLDGMVAGLSLTVCSRRIVGDYAALAATEAAQPQPAGSSRPTAPSHGDHD
jgi:hypothetical protein